MVELIRRSLLRSSLCLLTAGLLLVAPVSVVSVHADEPVQVSLVSPSGTTPLSGRATVEVGLVLPADHPDGSLSVSLPQTSTEVPLPAGTCTASCTMSASLDTLARTDDGPTELIIGVSFPSSDANLPGFEVLKRFPVIVDNHRPTLTITRDRPDGDSYQDRVTATVTPSTRDGADVQSIAWKIPPAPGTLAPVNGPEGPWQLDLDTSKLREDRWAGNLVITDSLGRSSLPIPFNFTVTRDMHLSIPVITSPVPDNRLLSIPVSYSYAPRFHDMHVTLAVVSIDGKDFSRQEWPPWLSENDNFNSGTVQVLLPTRVPAGRHTLGMAITDNHGLTNRISTDITVVQTASGTWQRRPPAELPVGTWSTLTASVTTLNSPVQGYNVDARRRGSRVTRSFGGSQLCQANCPTKLTATHKIVFDTPGVWDVTVTFQLAQNWNVSLTAPVKVIPVVTGRLAAAGTVPTGTRQSLSGTVTDSDGHRVTGARTQLQRRPAGTKNWSSLGSTTSDKNGQVSFSVTAPGTADYRLVVPSVAGVRAGTTGASRTIHSSATVLVTTKPTAVRKGMAAKIIATAKPSEASVVFKLQRYDSARKTWVTATTTKAGRYGNATFQYRPSRHSTKLRVLRATTAKADQGTSTTWKLVTH